jgi:hypothetical protein
MDPTSVKNIFNQFLFFIDRQSWTLCDNFAYQQTCEIDITDKLSDLNYPFAGTNPPIIQLIDMCRQLLKFKFEITYNDRTKKVIFYRFCTSKILNDIVPAMKSMVA